MLRWPILVNTASIHARPAPAHSPARALALAFALQFSVAVATALGASVLAPGLAHADTLGSFEEAETAYREQRYALASGILESVIATATTDSVDRAVLLESRKYLAACYLFLGRPDDADRQFELLLSQEPDYRVDSAVFPHEVIEHFEAVRARFEEVRTAQREAAVAEAEARIAAERTRLDAERARYAELYALASTSVVMRQNSRIVAFLPFGIGQFQNRRRRLGRFFAVAESLTLGLYVGSYAVNQRLAGREVSDQDALRYSNTLTGTRVLNWTSGALFLGLAVTGAVEAEVNYVPRRETTRPRPVPEHLRPEATETGPVTRLGVTPTSLFVRVDF